MNSISEFLQQPRKYINGWTTTKEDGGNAPGTTYFVFKENGTRQRITIPAGRIPWYFYIRKSDLDKYKKTVYAKQYRIQEGENWVRIFIDKALYKDPDVRSLVQGLENLGIETYEADVGNMKRIALDFDLQVEDWQNIDVLYFDIETDDTTNGIEIGRDRILSFGGVDRAGNEYFISDPDEKVLLNQMLALISKFDMLVGWNSKDFDMAYIQKRLKINKIWDNRFYNILHEDMMKRVMYFYSKDPEARQNITSYSLDFISNYFLGEGKIQRPGKVIDLYKNDFETFKAYNMRDCQLLRMIEEKIGTIELTYNMFQWCQCFAQNWSMVKALDNFILSDANKQGVHLRSNLNQMLSDGEDTSSGEDTQYLGAFVLEPIPGYYENVYDLDFKSLYPNIIRTFNIGPDSRSTEGILSPSVTTEDGTEHGGQYYSTTPGVIAKKITKLLEERASIREKQKGLAKSSAEYKNLNVQQLIVKELSNSIYGILGNKWYRGFSIELAESITATGQYLIKYVKQINEGKGRTAIYGDTDSLFLIIKPKEDIQKIIKWINKSIKDHFTKDFGVKDCTIEMDLDVKFDKFYIEAKKKYVGVSDGKTKFVGMECVKRDTIPLAVKLQKHLLGLVLNRTPAQELHDYIISRKEIVEKAKIDPEEITIRKKLSKAVHLYRAKSDRTYVPPIHVRIAAELQKENTSGDKTTDYSPGTIIPYIIVKGGIGKAEGVHLSRFDGTWDRTYYWNNTIYPLLERVLKTAYPNEDWNQYYIVAKKAPRKKADPKGDSVAEEEVD